MKKIITTLLILILNLNFLQAIAYDDFNSTKSPIKQIILLKKSLNNTYKWRKYVKIIDSFIKNNWYNEEILIKINSKISPIIQNSEIKQWETLNIIKYMSLKVNIALNKISKFDIINPKLDKLSSTDKKNIKNEIIKLQLNLFNSSIKQVNNLVDNFQNITNYEDKGDFKMNLDIDYGEIWKMNSYFNLNNYTAKTSNFNSEVKWEINGLINGKSKWKWEGDYTIKFSSFINFISKDGNIYLLLEKLNITDKKNNKVFKVYIDKIKKIASENKYIKYSDKNTEKAVKFLSALSPNKIINDWKNILSNPMLEVYKKNWDKFLLRPTKLACDTIKDLTKAFDPFNGSKCTEWQYKDMLIDLSKIWNIYMKIWNQNELGFSFTKDDVKSIWNIVYNNNQILEINTNIIDTQEGKTNEWLSLKFKNNKKLDIKLYANKWKVNYLLETKLDSKNNFTKINLLWSTRNKYNNFTIVLWLNNKKIKWNIQINNFKYDWDTDEYKKSTNYEININWKTNYKNTISSLDINTIAINTEDEKKFLVSNFIYKKWELIFNNYYTGKYINTDIELSWKWNSTTKVLTAWNLLISTKMKYWDNYNEMFKTDISLNNKVISGTTFINDWKKEIANIIHTGKYEKDYLQLNNLIKLEKNPFNTLKWYSISARNAKRISDLRNIQSAITLKLVEWYKVNELIIWNNVNYKTLNINRDDFIDPLDSSDYEIKFKWDSFQMMYKMENINWDRIARLGWNSKENLFKINWIEIKNDDIIEKSTTNNNNDKAIISNINFITDYQNNNQNVYIYIDFNTGSNKIFKFSIENIAKRYFKSININTPQNTINYNDIIWY